MWGRSRLGVRRLAALVANLPIGCALHRAADPEGFGAGWSQDTELLATLIELLDRHDRHFQRANSKKGARTTKPVVVQRPSDIAKRGQRRPATGDELRGMIGRLGGAAVGGARNGD